jgi:hypothetical protein
MRARLQDTAEHDKSSEVRGDAQWAIDWMAWLPSTINAPRHPSPSAVVGGLPGQPVIVPPRSLTVKPSP